MTIENKILNGEELNRYERKMCAFGNVGYYVEEIEGEVLRWARAMQTI